MPRFLLDEHLLPAIARTIRSLRPEIDVEVVTEWQGGAWRNRDDLLLLRAARDAGLTLVTFDQSTIRPLLLVLAATGEDHGGIVFLSRKTLDPAAFSQIARSLIQLWESARDVEWRNRLDYLRRT